MFFAPMLLLFAVSGAFQTFRLNEPKGWGGRPPQVLVWIGAIHRDQTPPDPVEVEQQAAKYAASLRAGGGPKASHTAVLIMKLFVVLVSLGMAVSIVLGMIIAFASRVTRRPAAMAFAAGAALPFVLILAQT
ncbi:hypothetical protein [Sphingomonas bacterium]|uniref:hypothetical protein n=1 Tax=Sphingomonas bacterium TaxID=1895847 RepID=UPI00262F7725|nr:hypothetical protein [Sphingomonas bacterium]